MASVPAKRRKSQTSSSASAACIASTIDARTLRVISSQASVHVRPHHMVPLQHSNALCASSAVGIGPCDGEQETIRKYISLFVLFQQICFMILEVSVTTNYK